MLRIISIHILATTHVFTLCMLGNFACFYRRLQIFFKINFSKKIFRECHQSVNGLDPDQARHFVRPDLGLNCLQRWSEDTKSRHQREKSLAIWILEIYTGRNHKLNDINVASSQLLMVKQTPSPFFLQQTKFFKFYPCFSKPNKSWYFMWISASRKFTWNVNLYFFWLGDGSLSSCTHNIC